MSDAIVDLLTDVCSDAVSGDARSVEESSSVGVVLVDFNAGGVSWTQDAEGVVSMESVVDHGVAISSGAESGLLEPSGCAGLVCPRGDEGLACSRRRCGVRVWGREREREAREEESGGSERSQEQMASLVFRDSVCAYDGQLGCVSDSVQFSDYSAQDAS